MPYWVEAACGPACSKAWGALKDMVVIGEEARNTRMVAGLHCGWYPLGRVIGLMPAPDGFTGNATM